MSTRQCEATVSVLANSANIQVYSKPFSYAIVDDALPKDVYQALSRTFPTLDAMPQKRSSANNRRFNLISDWGAAEYDLQTASPEWRSFLRTHSSQGFIDQVFSLFPDFVETHDGVTKLKIDKLGPSLSEDLGLDKSICLDEINARTTIAINTPVREVNRVRGIHTDAKRKAYVGLYYVRSEHDDSEGGDLEIHEWAEGASRQHWPVRVDDKNTNKVATIAYKANRFVIFPTTHDALHAVSPRETTDHVRRLVVTSGWLPGVDYYETATMHGRWSGYLARLKMWARRVTNKASRVQ